MFVSHNDRYILIVIVVDNILVIHYKLVLDHHERLMILSSYVLLVLAY